MAILIVPNGLVRATLVEWLIFIGVALFVISKFGGNNKQSAPAPIRGPSIADPGFNDRLAQWREDLAAEFDRKRWVPSSSIADLVETCPPPAWKGSSWLSPVGSTTPKALVLTEINRHNQLVLARKRTEKKAFFDTVEKNPLTAEQVHSVRYLQRRSSPSVRR